MMIPAPAQETTNFPQNSVTTSQQTAPSAIEAQVDSLYNNSNQNQYHNHYISYVLSPSSSSSV